ncbi:MAG: cell surface protein SprA, partial [Fibrobacterota bacterium]
KGARGERITRWFREYKDGLEYIINSKRGFVKFNTLLGTADIVLAVHKGDTSLIKEEHQKQEDPTWNLEMRNIYGIARGIRPEEKSEVEVTIKRRNSKGNMSERSEKGSTLYTDLLGISRGGDLDYSNDDILWEGYLIFPDLEPFASDELSKNPDETNPTLYSDNDNEPEFSLFVEAPVRRAEFSLGQMNITPGSETIKLNGKKLKKGTDYRIDYFGGTVTLLKEEHIISKGDIDVNFSYSPWFLPEKKVLLGARAEYRLPFISEESFIGATALYKSETSVEDRIQLNKEPNNNVLLDLNTKMVWEPYWMTDIANFFPFVETNRKSRLTISGEVARSTVNPNTKGEALVDDFESSVDPVIIATGFSSWKHSSEPVLYPAPGGGAPEDTVIGAYQAWGDRFNWYNSSVRWRDIIDDDENTDNANNILNLEMRDYENDIKGQTWGGVMQSLSASSSDRIEDAEYLEIWAKSSSGGVMVIDLGKISEDLRIGEDGTVNGEPNSLMDHEFTDDQTAISKENDLGLDGLPDEEEKRIVPAGLTEYTASDGSDSLVLELDTIRYSSLTTDPAGDNFLANKNDSLFFNGTESNSTSEPKRKNYEAEDTEDLNNNNVLDFQNSYFSFRIKLDGETDTNYSVSEMKPNSGWYKYIIPLNNPAKRDEYNSPRRDEITNVRLWLKTPESKQIKVEIAKVELVGNNWKKEEIDTSSSFSLPGEPPVASNNKSKMDVSVLSNYEDDDYSRPDFVPAETDDEGKELEEHALLLDFANMASGETETVSRVLLTPYDFSMYRTMKMYYQYREADDFIPAKDLDKVNLIFRFGKDSLNFYEVRRPLSKTGWDSINVDLTEFAILKTAFKNNHPTALASEIDTLSEEGLRVKGNPSYSSINKMWLGVQIDSLSTLRSRRFSGRIAVNDLKLTNVKKSSGYAGRVSAEADFADLFTVNSDTYYKSSEFLRLTEQYNTTGSSEMNSVFTTSLQGDKMMPRSWGISFPVNFNYSKKIQRPKIRPESDVELEPDRFGDIAPDLLNHIAGSDITESEITEAEKYQTLSSSRTISTSFSKNRKSGSIPAEYILERGRLAYSFSNRDMLNPSSIDTTNSHTLSYKYDLSPWKGTPTFEKWNLRLQAPNSIKIDIFRGDYSEASNYDRFNSVSEKKRNLKLDHGLNFRWKPVEIKKHLDFRTSFNTNINRDLNDAVEKRPLDRKILSTDILQTNNSSFIKNGNLDFAPLFLKHENTRSQKITYNLDWNSLPFLSNLNFSYDSDYRHTVKGRNREESDEYLDMTLGNNFSCGTSLDLVKMTSPVSSVSKFLDEKLKMKRFRYNYGVDTKNKTSGISRLDLTPSDLLSYQSGFYGRGPFDIFTGDYDSKAFGGMQHDTTGERSSDYFSKDTRNVSRRHSLSSSFDLLTYLKLNYSVSASRDWREQWSAPGISDSAADLLVDSQRTFPDFSIDTEILQFRRRIWSKIPVIGENSASATCNSSFRYSKSVSKNNNIILRDLDYSFNPLLRIDFKLRNRVEITYTRRQSLIKKYKSEFDTLVLDRILNKDTDLTGTESEKIIDYGDSITVGYVFRIKNVHQFLRWEWKLKNDLPVKVGFGRSIINKWSEQSSSIYGDDTSDVIKVWEADYNEQENKERPPEEMAEGTEYRTISSNVRYRVSKMVEAVLDYRWRKEYDLTKKEENDTQHLFKLSAIITF